jgi:hypothetical protein
VSYRIGSGPAGIDDSTGECGRGKTRKQSATQQHVRRFRFLLADPAGCCNFCVNYMTSASSNNIRRFNALAPAGGSVPTVY